MIADRCASKCRVRIAHATSRRGIKRVRIAHPTNVRILECHSREGGNPWGMCLRAERLNFEDRFLGDAKWIPAYAGMSGWPWATRGQGLLRLSTDMPVEAMALVVPGLGHPVRQASWRGWPQPCVSWQCKEKM